MITRKLQLIILLLSTLILQAQKKKELSVFFKSLKLKSKVYTNNFMFKDVQTFFLDKNWDSTLLYTAKMLSVDTNNKEMKNYIHFFRGYSFKRKRLFEAAKKEFYSIQKNFFYYDRLGMYLGEIALDLKEYKKAISFLKKIDTLKSEATIGIHKSSVFHNIGISYFHLNNYQKATLYLNKSIAIIKRKKDTSRLISSYADIGNLYYAQYKDDIAIPYYQKAYMLSKKTNNLEIKGRMAKNMAVIEENRRDFKKALQYRKEYEQWIDSLNNQNKIWKIAELEKNFAVKQKQNEINFFKAENRAKIAERNNMLYIAGALLLLLLVTVFFYRKNVKSKKIISKQNSRLDALNSMKDKLFSIVSHDLRSSVNTLKLSNKKLQAGLEKNNLEEVHHLLQKNSALVGGAYNLLDNLLNWALLQTKQAYFEIQPIHLFFTVEHIAYNYLPFIEEKEITFKNSVNKSIKVLADQESLKIILRNLLDNAIKFSQKKDAIKVYTEAGINNFINLIVEDSGIGMDKQTVLNLQENSHTINARKNKEIIGSGLGFQLCKSMIDKNNGKLKVESELGKGTRIVVSLRKVPTDG